MGVHSQLYEIPAAGGAPKALTTGNHAIGGWSYAPASGRHVFVKDDPAGADVWTMTTGAPAQVSHVFDRYAKDFRLPRQEKVEWKGADGVTVEGMLFYPLDYQAGTRYPLVVQTHGGPQASDKFGFGRWGNYTQVLAAKGYMVLQPNYRGSTGYGDPFLRDMVGHYFVNAHLDVMTGVDALIARGLVDGDRMAKMGWSGGGHMTNKIITFTNRFKAAASGAGAANWVSMYAQSDVRTYRTPWFGGTPWQANAPIDAYWNHSPLKDVAEGDHADDLPGRRRGHPRAAAAVGGDVPRAAQPGRADAPLSRAARAARLAGAAARAVQGERRARLVRAVRHKRAYTWEKAPERRGAEADDDDGAAALKLTADTRPRAAAVSLSASRSAGARSTCAVLLARLSAC